MRCNGLQRRQMDCNSQAISTKMEPCPHTSLISKGFVMYRVVFADELLPAQAFFNAIPDGEFVRVLRNLSENVSVGWNGVVCDLPDDDPESPKPGTVRFLIPGETIDVKNSEFVALVHIAILSFVRSNPDQRTAAEKVMDEIIRNFGRLDQELSVHLSERMSLVDELNGNL